VTSNPRVLEWYRSKAAKAEGTARSYASQLSRYWRNLLSRKYGSVDEWVDAVKVAQRSPEYEEQTRWARELEDYLHLARLAESSKVVTVSAIRSFLGRFIGPNSAKNYKFAFEIEEQETGPPMTSEELRQLVSEAKNRRDRAIILTGVSALGIAEWYSIFGNTNWWKYAAAIKSVEAPMRVDVFRRKTHTKYWTMISDDGMDALSDLLKERERALGRSLMTSDALFITTSGTPLSVDEIQHQIHWLADRAGIQSKIGHVYHVRFHAFRHFFKTLCSNSGIPWAYSEFLLGHKVDKLGYDKSPWTKEGEAKIAGFFDKLRPTLNILTRRGGKGEEQSHFEEIVQLLALMKDTDIHEMRQILERKIMEDPALRARISPKTDVKPEDMGSHLWQYRKPNFSGLTREEIFSVASQLAKATR
jgi:integrase